MGKIKVLNRDDCVDIKQVNDKAIAVFDCGKEKKSDLIIIANGIKSELRSYVDNTAAHGAEFDLKTGEALTPPASKGVTCYQTTTDENSIYIEVEKDA